MAFVSARHGVEHDDRVGVEILALPHADPISWRGIAHGHVQFSGYGIERVRRPGRAAADRKSRRVSPGRRIELRGALRAAGPIALSLGHEVELPHDFAGFGVERIHPPLAAFGVAARIADKNQSVPRDRGGGDELALVPVGNGCLPDSLAGLEVIGQHPSILGSAKQRAVEIRRPAHGGEDRGRDVLARAPILLASRRVDRKNIGQGRADQSPIDHDKAWLEARVLSGVVRAQDLQPADGLGVDLAQRRIAL